MSTIHASSVYAPVRDFPTFIVGNTSLLVTLWALTLGTQLSLGTNLRHKYPRQKGECLTQLRLILTSP